MPAAEPASVGATASIAQVWRLAEPRPTPMPAKARQTSRTAGCAWGSTASGIDAAASSELPKSAGRPRPIRGDRRPQEAGAVREDERAGEGLHDAEGDEDGEDRCDARPDRGEQEARQAAEDERAPADAVAEAARERLDDGKDDEVAG